MKRKPNDRNIIMGLASKTYKKELNWYNLNQNGISVDIWKSSEKITQNKSVSYSIFHNMDKPSTSYLTIHLETKYRKKDKNHDSIDQVHIRTIKDTVFVILMLKKAIETSGVKPLYQSFIVIQNEHHKNLILLTKNQLFDRNWVLPCSTMTTTNWMDNVKSEVKKHGLTTISVSQMKFRNIIKVEGVYYHIISYLVESYTGELFDKHKHMWIDKLDTHQYFIGVESKKVINFYNQDGLPF